MIYVGTCGYSYAEWIGNFYPGTIRKEEMLAFYAAVFPAVEIDASFYGILAKTTVARLNARTPREFRFCFKVPQSLTHAADPAASRVHPDAPLFVESVLPIRDAGKLGAVLAQFPNSFKPTAAARGYVAKLAAALEPLPIVVEFRSREWQNPQTSAMLSELGAGWCNVDMPGFDTLLKPSSDVTSRVGYVRFHGRNAQQWWIGNNTTRYDYAYSEQELVPWCGRTAEVAGQAEETFAFFNNHARGNAVQNAELFAQLLRDGFGSHAAALAAVHPRPPAQGTLFD